jgi:hypothetical protein
MKFAQLDEALELLRRISLSLERIANIANALLNESYSADRRGG